MADPERVVTRPVTLEISEAAAIYVLWGTLRVAPQQVPELIMERIHALSGAIKKIEDAIGDPPVVDSPGTT